MPSLLGLLSTNKKEQVFTGSIDGRKLNGKYQVDIGGRSLLVRSLIEAALPKGSRVIVVQVEGEFYITNKETVKDRQPLKVVVSG